MRVPATIRGLNGVPGRLIPPTAIQCVAVALAYVLCIWISGFLTPASTPIAPLWPPNSFLLAVLLLTPPRRWPLLLGGVLPVHLAIQMAHGIPLATSAGWYVSNSAEAVIGAACIKVFSPADHVLDTFRGVLVFIFFGVFFAPFVTTFADAIVVVDSGLSNHFWTIWNERFFSNVASNVVFTPPVIALVHSWRTGSFAGRRVWEVVSLVLISVVSVIPIFRYQPTATEPIALFLLLPILLWAAVRFGAAGASTAVLFIALEAVWETTRGRGPFVNEIRSLQVFFVILTLPLFCLGAVVEEQRTAKTTLVRNRRLSDLISEIASTFINIDWDLINDEINTSMRRLQAFLHSDMVGLFELVHGNKLALEFCARSERAETAPLSIDLTDLPQLSTALAQGGVVNITGSATNSAAQRALLQSLSANSILIMPVILDKSLSGILLIGSQENAEHYREDTWGLLRLYGEVIFDAIQRKHTMRSLAESEQRFRQIADSTPMLVWMSDLDGRYTYVNTAWITFTGLPGEKHDLLGWLGCVHPDDLEYVRSKIREAHERRTPFQLEYRLRRNDGEFRWILGRGVPRFASDGSFLGFVGSGFDVSDLKRAEEVLSQFTGKLILAQEIERRRIARELHDDIGQRIAVLAIELEGLQTGRGNVRAAAAKLFAEAKEIAASLRAISHNLHSTGLEVLPLGTALKGLCKDFSSSQPSILTSFSEEGLPAAVSQDTKLCIYRVAQEALQNVAKHSHASEIKVELKARENRLDLTISDNGLGFDPHEHSDLGLGLSSMRERVKALRGILQIRSAPGRGTTIHASLPLECQHTLVGEDVA